MFSLTVFAESKKGLLEIFETLSRFHNNILMKCGEIIVDAHSLIGVFSLETNKPIELLLESEPDEEFIQAISKYSISVA